MNIAEFARWCIDEGPFNGCDLDGGSVQQKAIECGLIVETKYDPDIHGESNIPCVSPGDRWYVFSDELTAMLEGK